MNFETRGNPDYGTLTVELGPGESFVGESGAMSYMSPGMNVKARMLGGFLKAVVRKMVAKESLLVGEYSHPTGGRITLSPATPGSIVRHTLRGESVTLTKGTFLACTEGIDLSTRFGGLKSFFSGEGAFFMKASGTGDIFFCSYGAIVEREISEAFVVDTSHVVGWEEGLEYKVQGMGGLKATLFSGEGLTLRFTGRGKLWLQTRTLPSFAHWIVPFLRG